MNLLPDELLISNDLLTGGQPKPEQLREAAAAGWQVVINLARPDSPGAFDGEDELAQELGMEYFAIPVLWEAPTEEDLELFFEAMEISRGKKVLAHCALNMRVSVFVFLYRLLRRGVPVEIAKEDLLAIWQPEGIWQKFIEKQLKDG